MTTELSRCFRTRRNDPAHHLIRRFSHCRLFIAGFLLLQTFSALEGQADFNHPPAAAELWRHLRGLGSSSSVLHVTAHPDDEDGPLLTWLARSEGVRTVLFTMNRGEGGANLISDLQEDRLGVLRTLEMSLAARDYGISHTFNRLADYGFSKRVEEALEKWGGAQLVVADLVRVIRRERPDILIARFRDDPRDGGGHATAHLVGLASKLAFEMAGSSDYFPDQLQEGLRPWKPAKLYLHSARPDQPSPPADSTISIDAGRYDPLLGGSYFEFSRRGLHRHRTQGMGARPPLPGPFEIHYERIASRVGAVSSREASFFDGLDTALGGMPDRFLEKGRREVWLKDELTELAELGSEAREKFSARSPDLIAPVLARALGTARRLRSRVEELQSNSEGMGEIVFRLDHEIESLQTALIQAAGIVLQAAVIAGPEDSRQRFRPLPTEPYVTPGSSITARLQLVRQSSVPIRVKEFGFRVPEGWRVESKEVLALPATLADSQALQAGIQVAPDASPDCPHWSRSSPRETVYSVLEPALRTRPLPPPPAWGQAVLEIFGESVSLQTALATQQLDHLVGLVPSPLRVAPAISLRFPEDRGLYRLDQAGRTVSIEVTAHQDQLEQVEIQLEVPPGWNVEPPQFEVDFERVNQVETLSFVVAAPRDVTTGSHLFSAVARHAGREFRKSFEPIRATPQSEAFPFCGSADFQLQVADLGIPPDLRIGYIMGSGDRIPQALEQLGVSVEILNPVALRTASRENFDTIVVGVRAYASRPDLIAQNQKLLEFVNQGGTLLVLYQTPEFDQNFGPYPYSMGNSPEEVTEESAPVRILDPKHRLWMAPNRISNNDFEDWVGERGSKFLSSWDPRYEAMLEAHDTNQPPQEGGLLVARYGAGFYVYSAYSFHRQLPNAVPGAFRIFANLLALGSSAE